MLRVHVGLIFRGLGLYWLFCTVSGGCEVFSPCDLISFCAALYMIDLPGCYIMSNFAALPCCGANTCPCCAPSLLSTVSSYPVDVVVRMHIGGLAIY